MTQVFCPVWPFTQCIPGAPELKKAAFFQDPGSDGGEKQANHEAVFSTIGQFVFHCFFQTLAWGVSSVCFLSRRRQMNLEQRHVQQLPLIVRWVVALLIQAARIL